MNIHDKKNTKKCAQSPTGPQPAPDAALVTPDSNVAADGHCIIPPHPESTRPGTGEPCDDGRDGE